MNNKNEFNIPDFDLSQSGMVDPNSSVNIPEMDEKKNLTQEEVIPLTSTEVKRVSNPDSIHVEISSKKLPVVLLFGPRSGGKTMVLVRLARYLKKNGYTVEPVRDFRPSDSDEYEAVCSEFRRNINSQTAAASTHNMNFMLIKVSKDGRPICQFLEAPGEHYFDEKEPTRAFPPYIHALLNLNMPRIWIFFLEKDWKDLGVKRDYADKISSMMNLLSNKDRIVLLYPKADKYVDLYERGLPKINLFFNNIKEDYESIFNRLSKPSLFTLFKDSSRDFEFVVFSSGVFSMRCDDGLQTFTESNDMYPAKLWNAILKSLRN